MYHMRAQAMPNNAQREPFQPLIPAMLDTVAQALNANEEETAQDAVELLIEVCVTGVVQLDVWCISCCCWMLRCCPIYMHQWAAYMHVGTATHSTPTIQQLAEAHPRFLRRLLGDVLNAMLQVAEAGSLDSATRQLAAEFAVTLCEARDKAPGMMRKLPAYIGRLFQCLVSFLFDIEVRPACNVL